jgi:hypothetical protein
MPDEKLTSVFDACMRGEGSDGWQAGSEEGFDWLSGPRLTRTMWYRADDSHWVKQVASNA